MRTIIAFLSLSVLLTSCKKEPTGPDDRKPLVVSNVSWEQTSLDSVRARSFLLSGGNLFAGTYDCVFLSGDNGTSWNAVNNGLDGIPVISLAVRDTTIFALQCYSGPGVPSGTGVHLSNDGGSVWTESNYGILPDGIYGFNTMAMILAGTNSYVATGTGFYVSTNNGAEWNFLSADLLASSRVRGFVINGTTLLAGTSDGVFRSSNNGMNWIASNSGLASVDVNALIVSENNLIAGTGGGVFLSTNNGTDWTTVNNGLTNTYVSCLAFSGSNLFAGTFGGVYLSIDNGTSWTAVNSGLTNHYVTSLAMSGTNIFAGTDGGGVFRGTMQ